MLRRSPGRVFTALLDRQRKATPPEAPLAPDAPDAPLAPLELVTVNVMGTLNEAGKLEPADPLAPDAPLAVRLEANVIVPVYVPGLSELESIRTVTVAGVVPSLGAINSHGVEPVLVAMAEKPRAVVPSVLVIEI